MRGNHAGLALCAIVAFAGSVMHCEVSVLDAPVSFGVPQITATPYDLNHRQSETAIVASSAFLFPLLVATYNDSSLPIINPAADYSTSIFRRGWSQLGWSTSATAGATWDYRGQVSPFLNGGSGTSGGGWSALIGDPSAAVDAKSKNLVYISNIAVSNAAWNAVSGGTDTIAFGSGIPFSGGTAFSPIDLSDSVCVAQSTDGGVSFSALGCLIVGDPGQADRTALTVDGNGFVWVSTIRVPGSNLANFGRFRLFRSVLPSSVSAFVEIPPPFTNVFDPVLKHDLEGNIWLGGQGVPSASNDGSLWLQKFDIKKNAWVTAKDVALNCGKKVDRDAKPVFGTFSALRNAHPYDFDIGLDDATSIGGGAGTEVVRVVFEQTDDADPLRHLVQVAQYDLNLAACATSPTTGPFSDSTTWPEAGTQFMPSLNYTDRSGDQFWSLVYLTTANVKDPTDQYIYPASERVTRVPLLPNPKLTLFTSLAPADWFACFDASGYWGDYFGVTQLRDTQGFWWNVSAFTSSRPAPPCTGSGSSPQHVVASRW